MSLLIHPGYRVIDGNEQDVAAGRLHIYLNRTSTYANIYSDPEMSVLLANPLDLDGGGLVPVNVYGEDLFTLRVEYSDGAEVYTRNDCFGWASLELLTYPTLAAAKAANLASIRVISGFPCKSSPPCAVNPAKTQWLGLGWLGLGVGPGGGLARHNCL